MMRWTAHRVLNAICLNIAQPLNLNHAICLQGRCRYLKYSRNPTKSLKHEPIQNKD
jgi:hypothetical protein